MVGYLTNQVYYFINQAMNRTFTKNLWSEASLQHYKSHQKHHESATAEGVLRLTINL